MQGDWWWPHMLLESGRDMTPNLAEVRLAVLGEQLHALGLSAKSITYSPLQPTYGGERALLEKRSGHVGLVPWFHLPVIGPFDVPRLVLAVHLLLRLWLLLLLLLLLLLVLFGVLASELFELLALSLLLGSILARHGRSVVGASSKRFFCLLHGPLIRPRIECVSRLGTRTRD